MSKLQRLKKGIKIFVNYFLGPALFTWIVYSIYQQISAQPNLRPAMQQMLRAFSANDAWKIWLALLLMPVNWAFETIKWQILVNSEYPFPFKSAFKSVLSGISLSLNTPNRIGEYGGRILYLAPAYRLKGIFLNLVSSVSQLLVTLVAGLLAFVVLRNELLAANGVMPNKDWWFWFVFLVAGFVTVGLTILYFRMHLLVKWLQKIPLVKERFSFSDAVKDLPVKTSIVLIGYSMLRFVVFATQYVLLWQALGVEMSLQHSYAGVAVIFFIMSVVPTIALIELGLRGKVALGVMGLFSNNAAAILTGTISVWMLNLIVPATLGALLKK